MRQVVKAVLKNTYFTWNEVLIAGLDAICHSNTHPRADCEHRDNESKSGYLKHRPDAEDDLDISISAKFIVWR